MRPSRRTCCSPPRTPVGSRAGIASPTLTAGDSYHLAIRTAFDTDPNLVGATTIGPFSAGERIDEQSRSRTVSGPLSCTTYYFRITANNQFGTTLGNIGRSTRRAGPTSSRSP